MTPNESVAQDGIAIEEIIVTARKREENLQEVPIAITAFTRVLAIRLRLTAVTGRCLQQATQRTSFPSADFTRAVS